jgi:hypothetical protein
MDSTIWGIKFSSDLTVNTFCLHWKGQWINAVEENNRYLLRETDETQNTLSLKKAVFKCNGQFTC